MMRYNMVTIPEERYNAMVRSYDEAMVMQAMYRDMLIRYHEGTLTVADRKKIQKLVAGGAR